MRAETVPRELALAPLLFVIKLSNMGIHPRQAVLVLVRNLGRLQWTETVVVSRVFDIAVQLPHSLDLKKHGRESHVAIAQCIRTATIEVVAPPRKRSRGQAA